MQQAFSSFGGDSAIWQWPATRFINRVLRDYPLARQRLSGFAGKTLQIHAGLFKTNLRITPAGEMEAMGVRTTADEALAFDVTLTIPLHVLPGLAAKQESAFRLVQFSGDSELAAVLAELAQHLNWDIEEDLSHIIGAAGAHRMVTTARAFQSWGTEATQRVSENIAEYLTEERRLLITRHEADEFAHNVQNLRDAVARLEKRVAKLIAVH